MANVLVIGSGGREHAMACSLAQSENVDNLFAIPGNPGMAEIAQIFDRKVSDHKEIVSFCFEKNIDLVVIGPEQPLSEGLADILKSNNINVFGCSAFTAQLESSKAFSKAICQEQNIKTADYKVFINLEDSLNYLKSISSFPIVIKADGLAAGKGVIIAHDLEAANKATNDIFSGVYGKQDKIVIEEFLEGVEISFFAVSDGKTVKSLGSAGDHKKVGEGEVGLNTGGMGTYSPSPFIENEDDYLKLFAEPIVEYFYKKQKPFVGILFCGLMLTEKGPYLIEYNVRFGDPEAQSILPRLKSDFFEICNAASNENLDKINIEFFDLKSVTVVLASNGYPLDYPKGTEIRNLSKVKEISNVNVFHAGTKVIENKIVSNGGRVLNINATGQSFLETLNTVYSAVEKIDWSDMYYRKDIAKKVASL
ncbi:MAG: phosphoribosylamine--glycine ligase [Rickettsiales bacterium]|nr:phosphoribosylamine--glycine ligase [Rickettsiales bacterium]